MSNKWKNEALAHAWAMANGSEDFPYGDNWRMALVNPLVIHLVERISEKLINGINIGDEWDHPSVLLEGLSIFNSNLQREHFFGGNPLKKWNDNAFNHINCKTPINILDLGCGEAYIGRNLFIRSLCNYIGIDISETLIEYGENRKNELEVKSPTTRDIRFKLIKGDLENSDDISSCFDSIDVKDCPHLVLSVISIDHLKNIDIILERIKRLISKSTKGAVCLFITLNQNYFLDEIFNQCLMANFADIPTEVDLIDLTIDSVDYCDVEVIGTEGDSSDLKVDATIRSDSKWKEIFRDHRFKIIDYTQLNFPIRYDPNLVKVDKRGIAPFEAYLVSPMTCVQDFGESEIDNVLKKIFSEGYCDTLSKFTANQKQILIDNKNKLELMMFNYGDIIVNRFDLGGDLFVIIDGLASLEEGQLTFQKGDVFGELELCLSNKETEYLKSVIACGESTKILRIPNKIAKKILEQGGSGIVIYRNLRNRIALWNYDMRGESEKSVNTTKMLSEHILKASVISTCRFLLAAMESERQQGVRSKSGRHIYISRELLSKKEKGLNRGAISYALRLLSYLEIITFINGKIIYEKEKNICKEMINNAFDMFFSPLILNELQSIREKVIDKLCIFGEKCTPINLISEDRNSTEVRAKWDDTFRKKILAGYSEFGIDITNNSIFQEGMQCWLAYLWNIYYEWLSSFPVFIIINDAHALKKIAYGGDINFTKTYIKNRYLSLYYCDEYAPGQIAQKIVFEKLPKLDDLSLKLFTERNGSLKSYINYYKSFINNDLNYNFARLNFSGSELSFDNLKPKSELDSYIAIYRWKCNICNRQRTI